MNKENCALKLVDEATSRLKGIFQNPKLISVQIAF